MPPAAPAVLSRGRGAVAPLRRWSRSEGWGALRSSASCVTTRKPIDLQARAAAARTDHLNAAARGASSGKSRWRQRPMLSIPAQWCAAAEFRNGMGGTRAPSTPKAVLCQIDHYAGRAAREQSLLARSATRPQAAQDTAVLRVLRVFPAQAGLNPTSARMANTTNSSTKVNRAGDCAQAPAKTDGVCVGGVHYVGVLAIATSSDHLPREMISMAPPCWWRSGGIAHGSLGAFGEPLTVHCFQEGYQTA